MLSPIGFIREFHFPKALRVREQSLQPNDRVVHSSSADERATLSLHPRLSPLCNEESYVGVIDVSDEFRYPDGFHQPFQVAKHVAIFRKESLLFLGIAKSRIFHSQGDCRTAHNTPERSSLFRFLLRR